MRRRPSWSTSFRLRQYLTGSLWLLPLIGAVAGAVLGELSRVPTAPGTFRPSCEYSASTATALLAAIVGATAALTGFVVTVSVLVVQMATSTFSARYMRLWYRDRVLRSLLAVLIGTFTFSFTLLRHVESDSVPARRRHASPASSWSLDLFLFLIFLDRFVHRLRPVAVAALVAEGRTARVRRVPSARRAGRTRPRSSPSRYAPREEPSLVVRSRGPGRSRRSTSRGLGPVRAREHDCPLVLAMRSATSCPPARRSIEVYGGDADRRATTSARSAA